MLISWEMKRERLVKMGFDVIEMWSHDFDQIKNDPYIDQRLRRWKTIYGLGNRIIRDSLFGGRVENFVIEHKCADDEEIKYVDFTSLYPYVLKNRRYPVGHPILITQDFKSIDQYFGFVSCTLLPPFDLQIPVLPIQSNNLLIFGLCTKCCQNQLQAWCIHSSDDRKISGTWTTAEVLLAISKGYVVDEIHLIHHYPESDENMFTAYIDKWLKIKQQVRDDK